MPRNKKLSKRERHAMTDMERIIFHMLENINPLQYPSAISWVAELIKVDASVTKTIYEHLIDLWGLTGKFGYGRSPWGLAVSKWRSTNGYPPLGKGRPNWRRPANWMPDGPMIDTAPTAVVPKNTRLFSRGLSEDERVVFGRLLSSVDHKDYRSATSWIVALMDSEPTVTKNVFTSLVSARCLVGMKGYSDNAWYNAMVRWRSGKGLGKLGKKPSDISWGSRPANFVGLEEPYFNVRSSEPRTDPEAVGDGSNNGKPSTYTASGIVDDVGQLVAESVMDWMDASGFVAVTFHNDGSVTAYRSTKQAREITLSVQEVVR